MYTAEDYWNLPEGKRAELIDGTFYGMASPNFRHQKLVSELQVVFPFDRDITVGIYGSLSINVAVLLDS